jgi:hypothetical protein
MHVLFFCMISRQADRRPRLPNQPIRAFLKGWHVGSAALLGAHLRVWPPFPLPRSGPREAKPPPPPGSSRTPFSTVAGGLGSTRRWAGDLRWRQVALAGSHGRRESSSRSSPSRNPLPIKATVVASSLIPPRSRDTPARLSWWCATRSSPRPTDFLSILPLRICSDSLMRLGLRAVRSSSSVPVLT